VPLGFEVVFVLQIGLRTFSASGNAPMGIVKKRSRLGSKKKEAAQNVVAAEKSSGQFFVGSPVWRAFLKKLQRPAGGGSLVARPVWQFYSLLSFNVFC